MHSYRADLALLRDRRFALLLGARTVSVLGASFAPVALAFGVLELPEATASTLSVVLAAQAVPMVAFMLLGGVIADRLPRQRVMVAGELMNVAAYLSLAAMFVTGWAPVPAMAAAAAISGIGMSAFYPAMTGIVPEVVPAHRLPAANGLLGVGVNSSRVLGLAAGGACVVLLGPGPALALACLLFAAAAALIGLMRLVPVARKGSGQSIVTELREGWQIFRGKQWLWVVVAQFSVLMMAQQAALGVLGPVVAKQDLGGAAAWSTMLAVKTVGMIAGVVLAMRLRPARPILLATLLMFPTALPFLALGLSAPMWTLIVTFTAMGLGVSIFGVLWQTTMQREIPAESLSRVSAYDALGSLMFGPIGLLLAGPAAITAGPRAALLGCAAIVVLSTLAALTAPGVRNLRAPDAAAPAQPAEPQLAGAETR